MYISLEKALKERDSNFIQCHKGFVVNIEKALSYDGKECNMGVVNRIPVGDKFKNNFDKLYVQHIRKYRRV